MPNISNELLPLVVQDSTVLVDARLLHQKLKSGRKYTDWIKYRINEYGFEANKDFFASQKNEAVFKGGGHNRVDYLLTLDMAKELAMLERNEIGRNIRRYFIAKEKELRGTSQLPREAEVFKGLQGKNINNRKLYPYRELLGRIGYNNKAGSCGHRVARYPGHFVKMGGIQYITAEFALHLYHQKKVYNNRAALKEMQPVIPFNFGEPLPLTFNQKGGSAW